ncbi:hypothetical protein pb186bvf_009614 [Paramecium bursaria]
MDQYIDTQISLKAFCKQYKFHEKLVKQVSEILNLNHPTLIMQNLQEIIKHKKKSACIDAPKNSGRTISCILTLFNLFLKSQKSQNEDCGDYLLIVSASRDKSIKVYNLLKKIIFDDIEIVDLNNFYPLNGQQVELVLPPQDKPVIILSTLHTIQKVKGIIPEESFNYCLFDDCNLAEIYGGNDLLADAANWITQSKFTIFVGQEQTIEKIIGKSLTVAKIEENEEIQHIQQDQEPNQKQDTIYYFLSKDEIQQYITFYVTLKLHLMQGKTLILVNDISQLYQVQLFLSRCQIDKFQIYNHQNPKSLKYYILSIFNTGVVQYLVATQEIFEDIKQYHERQNKKTLKNQEYTLKKVDNLIYFDFNPFHLENKYIQEVSTQLLILPNTEQNSEIVLNLTNQSRCKEFPLKINEIEAFRYRISDVVNNISKHQVKIAEELDFKKKILKSKDLAEYMLKNPKEKALLQDQIIRLKQQLTKFAVSLPSGSVPDYLLPEFILKQRKAEPQQSRIRVLVDVEDKNIDKIRKKRQIMNQLHNTDLMPQDEIKEEDAKPKGNRYVTVDLEQENPELVDASRLKIISSRKLWKLKHGFKLKKRNKRLEKKGIFSS